MIKGHTYDKQLYNSVAHRLINREFLSNKNGILNQGSKCSMTHTTNSVTVNDGFIVVQGGITEIEYSNTINIELDNSYCRLVYELDLSKVNDESNFNQGTLKVISSASEYPILTQQTLTENSGIYQYELAQFKATSTGITDFVDKRSYLRNDIITTPVGTINIYAGSTAPIGWLICDGSAISRADYADLFSIIGTTYGDGDGSTTFNLPNLKGKVPVGLDSNDTDFDALGETGGEKQHTLTIDEMPKHNHSISDVGWDRSGNTDLLHYETQNYGNQGLFYTTKTGNNQSHNNLQPYIVLNYIIAY